MNFETLKVRDKAAKLYLHIKS